MGKLYPDDLGEKIITRTDIDFVILIKERKENPNWYWDFQSLCQVWTIASHFSVCAYFLVQQRIDHEWNEEEDIEDNNIKLLLLHITTIWPFFYHQNFYDYYYDEMQPVD